MYPSQDASAGIGNLIALPLQGRALQNGNSAFIDEEWNAYPDQWKTLLSTRKLTLPQVQEYVANWSAEITGQTFMPLVIGEERWKPWRRQDFLHRADVTGILHITLADGIYVDALNLRTRIQNQIRCMATLDNPAYY